MWWTGHNPNAQGNLQRDDKDTEQWEQESCLAVQVVYSPDKIKILPTDEDLHCSTLQGLEGVHHAETVLSRVLADLFKVLGCNKHHNIHHQD